MTARLRELAERWRASADIAAAKGNMFNGGMIMTKQQCADELLSILDAEGDGGAVAWIEGAPDKTYASEWFIAQTTNRERVVLTALPEEYACDFKTADETYIKRENIKRWMQFPDSQFIPYTHPERSGGVSDAECREFLSRLPLYCSSAPIEMVRAALTHFAKGVEVGGDAEDAARYRWLRENGYDLIGEDRGNGPTFPEGDGLDQAIDDARKGERHE